MSSTPDLPPGFTRHEAHPIREAVGGLAKGVARKARGVVREAFASKDREWMRKEGWEDDLERRKRIDADIAQWAFNGRTIIRRLGIGAGIVIGSILLLWILLEGVWAYSRWLERPIKVSAQQVQRAAEAFVRAYHVGVDTFEDQPAPRIEQVVPSQWEATLSARGRNAFGGPVRQGYVVRLYSDTRGKIYLRDIRVTAATIPYSYP